MVDPVIQIKASCNEYPWGKVGKDSLAAKLCEKTPGWGGKGPNEKFQLDETKPYAEMYVLPLHVHIPHVLEIDERETGGMAHTQSSHPTHSTARISKMSSTRTQKSWSARTSSRNSATPSSHISPKSSLSQKLSPSKSTPTRISPASSIRRTPQTSQTQTTSPRSPLPSANSRPFAASNPWTK